MIPCARGAGACSKARDADQYNPAAVLRSAFGQVGKPVVQGLRVKGSERGEFGPEEFKIGRLEMR